MIYKNGTSIECDWINNFPIVESEFKYPNGDVYTGRHANGYKHGQGIMKYF